MKVFSMLLGAALGLVSFFVIIQGTVGVGLLVCGAVFFSAGCLGFWIEDAAKANEANLLPIEKLLTEIRDLQRPPKPAEPPRLPAAEPFDAAKAVAAMQDVQRMTRR